MSSAPIADLTYRNYDGPLGTPLYRWWAIAKMMMRLSIKKKSFWVFGALSGWWYFILGASFYFSESFSAAQGIPGPNQLLMRVKWNDMFLDGFSRSQLFLFIIALLIGVGQIANDNRANALLVYLSKPCTKTDYLIGKWFGIFIPLLCVVAGPTLFFYAYCAMSYRHYGFFTQDHWLILKLLVLFPVTPAFHASVSLGISSLLNQGRIAGAIYSGIYFMSDFFTLAIAGIMQTMGRPDPHIWKLLNTAFYFAVDGIQIAFAKLILGTRGSVLFGNTRGRLSTPPEIPSAPLFIALYLGICVLCLWIAWVRIRAVEVVGT